MTYSKKFKARVRARMEKTGESYMVAWRNESSEAGSIVKEPKPRDVVEAPMHHDAEDPISIAREASLRQWRRQSLDRWRAVTESLANGQGTVEWTSVPEIIQVLAHVGQHAPDTHLFFPDVGGMDFKGASESYESACIELTTTGRARVVRPVSLQLVMPDRDPLREWAYFILSTNGLAPSGLYPPHRERTAEGVCELSRGQYVDEDAWEAGVHGQDANGEPLPLPEEARPLERVFSGTFLLMARGSTYNSLNISYDGLQEKLGPAEFRELIEETVEKLHQRGHYGRRFDS